MIWLECYKYPVHHCSIARACRWGSAQLPLFASLAEALVFADNVLYPGAPSGTELSELRHVASLLESRAATTEPGMLRLFLNYIDVQGYQIEIHELKERCQEAIGLFRSCVIHELCRLHST